MRGAEIMDLMRHRVQQIVAPTMLGWSEGRLPGRLWCALVGHRGMTVTGGWRCTRCWASFGTQESYIIKVDPAE